MPPHNLATITPPRTIANVLLDLKEARRDWEQALTPKQDSAGFQLLASLVQEFIHSELGARNLYECDARYDNRASGYRARERDWRSEYDEWLASVGPQLTQVSCDPLRRVA